MGQTILAYALVTAAAGWVGWSMLLPAPVRAAVAERLAPQLEARGKAKGCGKDGCTCG